MCPAKIWIIFQIAKENIVFFIEYLIFIGKRQIYRMIATIQWMKEKYDEYNGKLFGGKLPRIQFIISNRMSRTWGFATYKFDLRNGRIVPISITMSSKYDSPEEVKLNTLLHEMIHILDYATCPEHYIERDLSWNAPYPYRRVSGREYDAHGEWFQEQCNRINKFGFKVSKFVQEWEKDASRLSDAELAKIERKKKEGSVFGFMHRVNVEMDTRQWFMVKTSAAGMRKYSALLMGDKEWYSRYEDYIEWYRCNTEYKINEKNTTKSGWWMSDERKNEVVSKNSMELVQKDVLSDTPVRDSGETVDGIARMIKSVLHDALHDFRFIRKGYVEVSQNDTLTRKPFTMTLDKGSDMARLTFGKETLNIRLSALKDSSESDGCLKYGKTVYDWLKKKGMIMEDRIKMKDGYARIIRETVDSFIKSDSSGVEVEGTPGVRRVSREVGDGEFIESVE